MLLRLQKKRTELLGELSEKESLSSKLKGELDLYKEVDPEVLEQIKTETKIAQEAANRWTGQYTLLTLDHKKRIPKIIVNRCQRSYKHKHLPR